ncbi:hypothetical protein CEXT_267871 [Caerostris extrusa]|uniref:Uncharacterized protein n=1 Tax=Caerostris extrusa TaxID=172846 RepID=A0AAV4TPC9_CAEEX|nr:hypothetical protein CEXT_267871 [Caerostris extrusa]
MQRDISHYHCARLVQYIVKALPDWSPMDISRETAKEKNECKEGIGREGSIFCVPSFHRIPLTILKIPASNAYEKGAFQGLKKWNIGIRYSCEGSLE